jgi:predicted kinase
VYLLCGLTGSGKTTSAKRLEAAGAVRLSVDEQADARHGRYGVDYRMEEYFDRERPVVQKLRRRLVELVESGRAVVLDYGLRRSDRDADKRLVEAHGGSWRLLSLKVDREVLLQRLVERNRRGDANALMVTPSALEDFIARFDSSRLPSSLVMSRTRTRSATWPPSTTSMSPGVLIQQAPSGQPAISTKRGNNARTALG